MRGVLQQLLNETLLCFTRLKEESSGSVSPSDESASQQPVRPGVRNLLHHWWPVWEDPTGAAMQCPPPGTVGFLVHPSRPVSTSRWGIEVNMSSINAVIRLLAVKSARYFEKSNLRAVVSVSRFTPNVRATIGVSVATFFLVATKEDAFVQSCQTCHPRAVHLSQAEQPCCLPRVTSSKRML